MILAGVPLTLITLVAGTAVAFPAARHIASALWNVPDRLPALPGNSLIHFEPGAEDYAHDVAALLPAAIATVEAIHGRRFEHPVLVGVYRTREAYAVANATGSAGAVGVTAFGRVVLSPSLINWPQHRRLRAILTHELSHAHLQGYMSAYAWVRLPNWFKEGVAVMASGGGGAEFVSEREARAAIEHGERIAIEDTGSFANLSEISFERAPAGVTPSDRTVMAYRQAGMFVSWLHDTDTPGFARMMKAILDGHPFVEAVDRGYHQNVRSLWQQFTQQ